MIQLTHAPIDFAALSESVRSTQAGAVVLFLGTVREMTHGRQTVALDYDAYPEMAEAKLKELEAEARSRWPVIEAGIVHRLGHLELGDVSVAVAVSSRSLFNSLATSISMGGVASNISIGGSSTTTGISGSLAVNGSYILNVVSGTTAPTYTIGVTEHVVVFTNNVVTATLPASSPIGRRIIFKDGTGNAATAGGQMLSCSVGIVDGTATYTLPSIDYTSVSAIKINDPNVWILV